MPFAEIWVFIVDTKVGHWIAATFITVALIAGVAWGLVHHGEKAERERQAQQQAAQIEANRRAADAAQDRAAQDPNPQGTLQRDWGR